MEINSSEIIHNKEGVENKKTISKTKRGILKGPEDGEILTINFVGQAKQHFDSLKKTKTLILISIKDNELCTGEYFEATAKCAVAAYGFTTFLIADEVYWHNLKSKEFISGQENHLRQQAVMLGDQWFEKNIESFLKLVNTNLSEFDQLHFDKSASEKIELINKLASEHSLNFEIIRWHDWISSQKTDFMEKSTAIAQLYQTEASLITGVETSARAYAKRHNNDQEFNIKLENSKSYLTEESPAVIWIAAVANYNFIAYAGEMIESLKATRDFFVGGVNKLQNQNRNLLPVVNDPTRAVNWLTIHFKREYSARQKLSNKTRINAVGDKFINTPTSFFQPSSPTNHLLIACMQGLVKAIMDYPTDNETKVNLMAGVIHKLTNTNISEEDTINILQSFNYTSSQ